MIFGMGDTRSSPLPLLWLALVLLTQTTLCWAAPLEVSSFSIDIVQLQDLSDHDATVTGAAVVHKSDAVRLMFEADGEVFQYVLHYHRSGFFAPGAKVTKVTDTGSTTHPAQDVHVFGGPSDDAVLTRLGKVWRGTVKRGGRFLDIETVERAEGNQVLLV